MIRSLLVFLLLGRMRRQCPESFDGHLAAESVRACLAEEAARLAGPLP